jgi:cell fate (sporulation/competence/biofilm development) regulator YmcA (YheA/YmcA/DUF963 family)
MKKQIEIIDRILSPHNDIFRITENARSTQKSFANMAQIGKSFADMAQIQKSFADKIQESFAKIPVFPKFENNFFELSQSMADIGKRLQIYLEKTPEHLLIIARHGWFIELDSEMKLPSNIVYEIENGNVLKADEQLIEYYNSNIGRIFDELVDRHPSRTPIFKEILSSYNSDKHFTLIPCVLSQIDGICHDFTKKKFFIKNKKSHLPEITLEIENATGNFIDLFLSPLQNQTPINAWEKDPVKYPCNLNRHEIIHGTNIIYGTKINSLKCISLLKYISDLLIEVDRKHK